MTGKNWPSPVVQRSGWAIEVKIKPVRINKGALRKIIK